MTILEEKEYDDLMEKWSNYKKLTKEESKRRIELVNRKFEEKALKIIFGYVDESEISRSDSFKNYCP